MHIKLTQKIFNHLRYLFFKKILLFTNNYQELLKLKDKHLGQRGFVIGNGPSLRSQDLSLLKKEITFASNRIYLAFDKTDWRPTYYSVEDSLVLAQNQEQIKNITNTHKLFPSDITKYIYPINNSLYFNFSRTKFYPQEPNFGINALNCLYWGSTITYTLLQLACYMGIREIYLLGIDHNYDVPKQYEKGEKPFVVNNVKNHFHPDYLKPGEKMHPPNLHQLDKAYLSAKKAIGQLNGQIYNATRGGKLEIFPRVDFDTLF